MKCIIILLMTFFAFSANGQHRPEIRKEDSWMTANHVNIPGTRLFIIPPAGFEIATSFTGLQKGEAAYIQIYDLVGGDYYTNAATFNSTAFEKEGAIVYDFKEYKIQGFPAKYILMGYDSTLKSISIVFGNTTFSTMITAVYAFNDDKTEQEIQSSLKTIYYKPHHIIDPLAAAAFTLDESKSTFKYSLLSAGMHVYSIGNSSEIKSTNDDPMIIVSTIPREPKMTPKNIVEIYEKKIDQYGFSDKESKNISTENVNGYPAYEMEVYGKLNGAKTLLYYLIVMGPDKTIVMQGVIKSNFEEHLKEMKKLVKTIQLK